MVKEIYVQARKRIQELRKKYGYTREKFAELVNISSKFLYEIEVGSKGFSAQTLSMIAKNLNVSCDYILYGKIECSSIKDINFILNRIPEEKKSQILEIFNTIYNLLIT